MQTSKHESKHCDFFLGELRIWAVVGPRGPCGGANPPSPTVIQGESQVTELNNNSAEILVASVLCGKGWGCDENVCILNFCVWSVLMPNPVCAVSIFCSNDCFLQHWNIFGILKLLFSDVSAPKRGKYR